MGALEVARPEGFEDLPMSDFPLMAFHVPVFNERAAGLLRPLLIDNGERLPLLCDERTYFAHNVTTVPEALDLEKSSVIHFTSGRIMDITRHEFLQGKGYSLDLQDSASAADGRIRNG